jgi:pimeloyl-ACP methyl ester carboxylesterase
LGRQRITRRTLLRGSAALACAAWLRPVSANAQSAAAAPRPLILVHGFADQIGSWYRPDNGLVAQLAAAGYGWEADRLIPFRYPSLPRQPESEDSQGDIAAAGLQLARVVEQAAARASDGQVDVLGFSMGGLVTRWAIAYLRDRYPRGQQPIRQALIVATPNAGVDVLLWLDSLGQRTQASLYQLARELASLDLESTGAQQMMPRCEFLDRLNDPAQADERVRHVVVAGTMRLTLRLGRFGTAFDIGDGLISSGSATYLPGLSPLVYTLPEQLSAGAESPQAAMRRSQVFHPRLILNENVGLIAAAELSDASAAQGALEARLAAGTVTRDQAAG